MILSHEHSRRGAGRSKRDDTPIFDQRGGGRRQPRPAAAGGDQPAPTDGTPISIRGFCPEPHPFEGRGYVVIPMSVFNRIGHLCYNEQVRRGYHWALATTVQDEQGEHSEPAYEGWIT